jgi:phosphopantetheinyl transferase
MPLILHTPILQSGILAVFRADEMPLPTFTSHSEQLDYEKLGNSKRQRERLATLHLLHNILNVSAALMYTPDGAPLLSDRSANISISHTKNLVSIALHPTKKVGVDMEDTTRRFEHLAKRFLSQKEQELLPKQNLAYCLAWCAKEAIYKITGKDNFDLSKQIEIHPFEPQESGEFTATALGNNNQKDFALNYRLVEQNAIVVAYEKN